MYIHVHTCLTRDCAETERKFNQPHQSCSVQQWYPFSTCFLLPFYMNTLIHYHFPLQLVECTVYQGTCTFCQTLLLLQSERAQCMYIVCTLHLCTTGTFKTPADLVCDIIVLLCKSAHVLEQGFPPTIRNSVTCMKMLLVPIVCTQS